MASALDRLLKKYTLEDSGSGGGSTGRKKLPLYPSDTTPAVTLPTPAAADSMAGRATLPAGLLAAGTPEYQQWWSDYQKHWFDPVSGRTMSGVMYENADPLTSLGDWRGGDSTLSRAGAVNVAFDPAKNEFVGLDASGNPIESTRGSTLTQDNAFWNAALLAGGLVGGAVNSWASAGNGMGGGTAATTGVEAGSGALPTSATDAALSQVPADYLGQSSITGTLPTANPSWFNPELLKMAAPTLAEKVTQSEPDYTANPYSDPSRSLDTLPPSLNDTDPSWLDSLQGYGKDVVDWAKKNPGIAKLLFGATGAALGGTGGSSGGGYSYSGPMPTISRQGWSPTAQQQTLIGGPSMGMLDVKPGEAMSGLWRYGLLGGGGK